MSTKPPIRVAFGNKARSGKDTACEYLCKKFGGEIIRFSKPVYQIHNYINKLLDLPDTKNPLLLQTIGGMRDSGVIPKDSYVKCLMQEIEAIPDNINIFIADLRYKNELEMLKDHGFICIQIQRVSRPIDRDPTAISETDLDNDIGWDHIIYNNDTIEEFYTVLDSLI